VTFFKSLKSAYNRNADSWMVANPGKRISVYEIATIFGKAYLQTATPEKREVNNTNSDRIDLN